MNSKFKVGDRIRNRLYPSFGVGVIKGIEGQVYEIEFENKTGGHATYPNCREGYGYLMRDERNFELVDTFTKVSNKQLGAVYLKIDGLDKERFKKLTEGMKFYSTVEQELNDGLSYIEYYKGIGALNGYLRSLLNPKPN